MNNIFNLAQTTFRMYNLSAVEHKCTITQHKHVIINLIALAARRL